MSQPPLKDIRTPGPPPTLQAVVQALTDKFRGTPQQPIVEALSKLAYLQDEFNRRQTGRYNSAPGPHGSTHLPNSPLDPLAVGVPSGLANSNIEGTANAFVRRDHQHKRDVRVKLASADVGTRNALNFVSGATVVDNPGADAVDVTVGVSDDDQVLAYYGL